MEMHNAPVCKVKKLVANLLSKEQYVLHCRNLQMYLKFEIT